MLAAYGAAAKDLPVKAWKAALAGHLHVAPNNGSPIVAVVPKDALLTPLQACTKGWCAVEYKGFRGWIYEIFIAGHPAIDAAPLAAPQLAKAALLRPSPAHPLPADEPKEGASANYRLTGVASNENLPVRAAPLDTARVIGAIPADATNIAKLETCKRLWCLVERDGLKGYVQSRFIARDGTPSRKYGVLGDAGLKVFNFAGPEAGVVGEIPYYASGIVPIGDCNGAWCHIRYLGLVGFVEARRLRLEPSPKA